MAMLGSFNPQEVSEDEQGVAAFREWVGYFQLPMKAFLEKALLEQEEELSGGIYVEKDPVAAIEHMGGPESDFYSINMFIAPPCVDIKCEKCCRSKEFSFKSFMAMNGINQDKNKNDTNNLSRCYHIGLDTFTMWSYPELAKPEPIIFHSVYICQVCKSEMGYWIEASLQIPESIKQASLKVKKVGQYPSPEAEITDEVAATLKEALGSYDQSVINLYRNALRFEQLGYGIAAYAYYRQIFEKCINGLLQLTLQKTSSPPEERAHLANICNKKGDTTNKIRAISKELPRVFNDTQDNDGNRALLTMWKLLSDGIHNLSDLECLQTAEQIKVGLEVLIGSVATKKRKQQKQTRHKKALKNLVVYSRPQKSTPTSK